MIQELEGIVLSDHDYGETSKVLHVLTKEHGVIGVMAKGCKTMKSELRSVSHKLTYGFFHVYFKKDKLSNLMSIDVINSFKHIMTDIEKISFASFLLELGEQVFRQNNTTDIYELLKQGILKIEEGFDPQVIMNIVELKLLDYLGVMPVLDACVKCGSQTSITTLSSSLGGYICKKCRTNEYIVSEKTMKLIRLFYYVDLSKISKLEISPISKKEINQFLDEYYDRYTGLYLKSKGFIQKLKEVGGNGNA